MRLLNTKTMELADFIGEVPPYAILSHTWDEDEDIDIRNVVDAAHARDASNVEEIDDFRYVEDTFDWIWIDTCCIDKSSSSELSEAINSMYNWYEGASVCFAYLSDVHSRVDMTEFARSRWFTRGWTLQELVAPRNVELYTSTWELIGSKVVPGEVDLDTTTQIDTPVDLTANISTATGIREEYLRRSFKIDPSVAEKMSWAAKRSTSRKEDIAYCLLGLFDVNMPLLYGEGCSKAFLRLQCEMMPRTNDDSILVWGWRGTSAERNTHNPYVSYLAVSPARFAYCVDIVRAKVRPKGIDLVTTNRGMELEAPLCRYINSVLNLGYYIPI
ncbi:hypothetical protein GE09DRAFT_973896 [Coniochaeta sp. 2T2.1]|nr:hypothetical protein GE09DRAFT_973896 [Coniochaeta sp. 2T2.1]